METTMNLRNRRIMVLASFAVLALCLLFWYTSKTINVYANAALGAMFEIAWLPVIACTFLLPLFSLFRLYKDRWRLTSPFLLIAVLSVAVVGYVTELI